MKTTELFVEQVLIGLVVLATGALMISNDLFQRVLDANLGKIALLLAGAYLVGIVYDRFGDTLLGHLEQHHRLLFALEQYGKSAGDPDDPYPEARYRIRILADGEASGRAHYLRSRMRLTRALATIVPGLSVAVAVALVDEPADRLAGGLLVIGVYALAFIGEVRRGKFKPEEFKQDPKRVRALPKTRHLRDDEIRPWYDRRYGNLRSLWVLRRDGNWLSVLALSVAAGVLAWRYGVPEIAVAISLASLALTGLCLWSWWRISETFYTFLSNYDKFSPQGDSGGH